MSALFPLTALRRHAEVDLEAARRAAERGELGEAVKAIGLACRSFRALERYGGPATTTWAQPLLTEVIRALRGRKERSR